MTEEEIEKEEMEKTRAVEHEIKRRGVALVNAFNALRECCKGCSRVGLCTIEKCSVYYAMKYRPLGRVMLAVDEVAGICDAVRLDLANKSGCVSGRPISSPLVLDEIKL